MNWTFARASGLGNRDRDHPQSTASRERIAYRTACHDGRPLTINASWQLFPAEAICRLMPIPNYGSPKGGPISSRNAVFVMRRKLQFPKSLVRLLLVWLAAAGLGWFGLSLMYLGTPFVPMIGEFWTNYVMIASIIVWSIAGFLLRERSRLAWLCFGLVSPLLGAMLVAPPASFAFVIAKGYIAFPVGVATGLLMYTLWHIDVPTRSAESR